ncbi:MAG: CPBP family intramembrane metalloprotease [Promethearchaeota archaeon]|nr:MAG: CPBP family intramembrane metalloprotease [Candidatus Lokiarchaeota archaeon]
MIKVRKYIILSCLLITLIIPMFFGFFIEYFRIIELNWCVFLIFIIGLLILLFLGKIIEVFGYNDKNIEVIKKQDVISAFINKDNKLIIWLFFPIIIVIEELIFRYYLIGFLIQTLESVLVIFISSIAFSLFHIHIWFRYKNLKILLINLGYPFLMGLYSGYIFLKLGIIHCILVHYVIALSMYYGIYRRYFKT